MTVQLYLDRRLLEERADAAVLGAALLALRGRRRAELELAGERESLILEKRAAVLAVSLVDNSGRSENAVGVVWDDAAEAAAEFLAELPGRDGGLLAELRKPWGGDDDCPACDAMKEGLL